MIYETFIEILRKIPLLKICTYEFYFMDNLLITKLNFCGNLVIIFFLLFKTNNNILN